MNREKKYVRSDAKPIVRRFESFVYQTTELPEYLWEWMNML